MNNELPNPQNRLKERLEMEKFLEKTKPYLRRSELGSANPGGPRLNGNKTVKDSEKPPVLRKRSDEPCESSDRPSLDSPAPESDQSAGKSGEKAKLGYSGGELLNLEIPDREEIIVGLARGERGILNAVGNVGKTTLLRNLTLSAAAGRAFPPFGEFSIPIRVAFLDFEETLSGLKNDLAVMINRFTEREKGLISGNTLFICDHRINEEDLNLSNKSHLVKVINRLDSFAPDLIIVDTISSGFDVTNENDNAEVRRRVMRPLKQLAKSCNAADLATHHIGKAKAEEAQTKEASHRGRGASSFADMSRLILNLERREQDIILSCAKVKGPKFQDTLLRLDETTRWFEIIDRLPAAESGRSRVVAYFNDGHEHKMQDLITSFDGIISESSVKRHVRDAVKDRLLELVKHGIYRKARNVTSICT